MGIRAWTVVVRYNDGSKVCYGFIGTEEEVAYEVLGYYTAEAQTEVERADYWLTD